MLSYPLEHLLRIVQLGAVGELKGDVARLGKYPAELRPGLSRHAFDQCPSAFRDKGRRRLERLDEGLQPRDDISCFRRVHYGFNPASPLLCKFRSDNRLGPPDRTLSAPMVHRGCPD